MDLKEFCAKNRYVLKDSIDWDWDRYGDCYVSVTTILQLLVEPSFEYVKRAHADKIVEACERGKKIHSGAEDFFNGGSPECDLRIIKFHSLYDVKVVRQEHRYFKDGVSGSVDLECMMRSDPRIFNIDYKSSSKKSAKYRLQVSGYYWLNGNPGGILYLGEGVKYVYEEVDVEEYLLVFLELKDYFFKLLNRGRPALT